MGNNQEETTLRNAAGSSNAFAQIPTPKSDRFEMLTKTALKARGWTESLIRSFVPEPDRVRKNPRYASAAPMKLYLLTRVEGIEGTAQWQERSAAARKRGESCSRAASKKAWRLLKRLRDEEFDVPLLPKHDLLKRACEHYNEMALAREKPFWAKPTSDSAFLDRICVNYLRHQLSDYELELDFVHGKVGADAARSIIRTKIYSSIAARYPELAKECKLQLDIRLEEGMKDQGLEAAMDLGEEP